MTKEQIEEDTEIKYPCSRYQTYGCGLDFSPPKYKEDCYFYGETKDMGAIIRYCTQSEIKWDYCPCDKCDKYISDTEANKIIRKYVEKRTESKKEKIKMPFRRPTLKERFVEEFSDLVEGRDPRKMGIKAIFNTLLRGYPCETASTTPEKFMKWLMSLTIGDLIDINEMGPIRIKTVLAIQERIQGTDGLQGRLLQNCDKIG